MCQRFGAQRRRSLLWQWHTLHLDTWAGAQIWEPDSRRELCGDRREKLPRVSFPNAYPGADPRLRHWTTFDSAGNVTGGHGFENVITATAHSNYHALQTSLTGTVVHGGPGIQASYTWSKSIDDTSQVIGGTGFHGSRCAGVSAEPIRHAS